MGTLIFKRIKMEDLQGAPQWVATLLNPLNLFMEQCTNLINGQLVMQQNINGQVYTTTFTTPAAYLDNTGAPTGKFNGFNFQYKGQSQPSNVLIGSITDQSGALITYPTSVQWTYNNNTKPASISITYVAGLSNSKNYSITLAVF